MSCPPRTRMIDATVIASVIAVALWSSPGARAQEPDPPTAGGLTHLRIQIPSHRTEEREYVRSARDIAFAEDGERVVLLASGLVMAWDVDSQNQVFVRDQMETHGRVTGDQTFHLLEEQVIQVRTRPSEAAGTDKKAGTKDAKKDAKKKDEKKTRKPIPSSEWPVEFLDAFTGEKRKRFVPATPQLRCTPNLPRGTDWLPTEGMLLPVVSVFDPKTEKVVETLSAPWPGGEYVREEFQAVAACLSRDRKQAIAVLHTGTITVWDLGSGNPPRTLRIRSSFPKRGSTRDGVNLSWLDDGRLALNLQTHIVLVDIASGEWANDGTVDYSPPEPPRGSRIESGDTTYGEQVADAMLLTRDGSRLLRVRHYDRTPPAPVSGRVGGARHPDIVLVSRLDLFDTMARTFLGSLTSTENNTILRLATDRTGSRFAICTANGGVHLFSRSTLDAMAAQGATLD